METGSAHAGQVADKKQDIAARLKVFLFLTAAAGIF
jgi:hypothetical protein